MRPPVVVAGSVCSLFEVVLIVVIVETNSVVAGSVVSFSVVVDVVAIVCVAVVIRQFSFNSEIKVIRFHSLLQ